MVAFDSSKVTVVFVLGGPGAGKGTQCSKLVKDYNFCHLSAGDLLRAEQNRDGSQYGELIRTNIREGKIVPSFVTLKLLENAMTDVLKTKSGEDKGWRDGHGRFLIDGFPRKMDQAQLFDDEICLSSLVIFYDTTEEVLERRLLERAKTSGREDDNIDSIRKRFRTYKNETMPVINYYEGKGKTATIDGSGSIEEVYVVTTGVIDKVLASTTPKQL
ncbi:UMP-CMP kinase [Macrolepiota fuliginosa MF-IS2]|uniref:Uridylate kinase n=1 Tax=Macrolepiota fuliginosa MF-IS2 TaxID=1400762 RepID=A0A9P6C3Z4_9AGAR|nr:UMP-CMP kinase [Macrolepiota fuliginosa MF-IS2]